MYFLRSYRMGRSRSLGESLATSFRLAEHRPVALRTYVRSRRAMHFEVDVVVQHPLDDQAKRFLSTVQRSANRVVRFRGDDHRIVVTVEAHAYDHDGAVRAAVQEVAHIYPLVRFTTSGDPRPLGP